MRKGTSNIPVILTALSVTAVSFAQQPASGPAAADTRLQVKLEPEFLTANVGDRPILRYRYENGPKPYIKELYTPKGIQFLLDSPPDHVHHRGIMFAIAVDGVDFWTEGENTGKQLNDSMRTKPLVPGRDDEMVFMQSVEWRAPTDKLVFTEHRRVDVHRGPEVLASGATLLTWRTALVRSDPRDAPLTGSHYSGLGLRFVRSMDKIGKFVTSDPSATPEVVRGDEKLYPGRWCAYLASVDGKPVTVAMFDGPDNVRPATWFTMKDPFAYLSATLKLHKEPLTLKMGEPLYLTYGIAAWDGEVTPDQIEKLYGTWLELLAKAQPSGQRNLSTMPAETKERLKKLR
jgi:hypothetical protein